MAMSLTWRRWRPGHARPADSMDIRKAGLVAAKRLHDCFARAIKRRRVPDMDLCAELAEQIEPLLSLLKAMYAARQRAFVRRWRKDAAEAVIAARHFAATLRRLQPDGQNRLITRDAVDEDLRLKLDKWLEWHGQWPHRETESDLRVACADAFTPRIVETLRKAGWRRISTDSDGGPVTAVLSMLIGAVTGEEPPDQASVGRTLREAKLAARASAGGKTRRNSNASSSDVSSRKSA